MRAVPLVVNFHNESAPIYSAHFEPHGKGRLATGGGDNNVRVSTGTASIQRPTELSADSIDSSGGSKQVGKIVKSATLQRW